MHVEAVTRLIPREVLARIASPRGADADPDALRCELERQPPKVFLSGPVPFAPAAELRIDPLPQGSHVTLRLMWGPLPAPFPRALAGVSALLGFALVAIFSPSPLSVAVAGVLILAPAAALWRQRAGEQRLQDHLAAVLDSGVFTPRPH